MGDKKFEDILDEWMSYEIQEAPELRPREELYKRIKEKQGKHKWSLFPMPLRWAAIGAAAAVAMLMVIFYPGQERSAIGLRKGYVTERGESHKGEVAKPKKGEKRGEKKGPMTFDVLLFQYQNKGQSLIEEIDILAPKEEKIFLASDDNYRLLFQVRKECYIYVYQKDSRQILTRLFPNDKYSSGQNPVRKGRLYPLPAAPNWLYSKKRGGEEKIYVIASSSPKLTWDELYDKYSRLKSRSEKQKMVSRLLKEFAEAEKGIIEGAEVQVFSFHK